MFASFSHSRMPYVVFVNCNVRYTQGQNSHTEQLIQYCFNTYFECSNTAMFSDLFYIYPRVLLVLSLVCSNRTSVCVANYHCDVAFISDMEVINASRMKIDIADKKKPQDYSQFYSKLLLLLIYF